MRIARLRGRSGLQIRVAIYVLVIAGLFALRGEVDWRGFFSRLQPPRPGEDALTLGGADVAPGLMPLLVESYLRDYPGVEIQTRGGGSAHALEDLINGRADVALLCRPPASHEQELFLTASGDTVLCYSIALGGLILRRGEGSELREISTDTLREHLLQGTHAFDRLYAPDPNLGLWAAFCSRLGVPDPVTELRDRVIFLLDEAAVLDALATDSRALGLTGSLSLSEDPGFLESTTVEVSGPPGTESVAATYGTVASGAYPLHYYLYVCCLRNAGVNGSKFVTHATSARGQRQIEREGFLPARHSARSVYLTQDSVGDKE